MKYFLDTEFIEDGKTIDLISIGIVTEDGREYYAESLEAEFSKASEWVRQNVLPNLWSRQVNKSAYNAWVRDGGAGGLMSRKEIAFSARNFCDPKKFGEPQFWAYYAAYDWVAFCQLFGTLMDLPKGFPKYCRDINQLCDERGNPALPKKQNKHNALADAQWNKSAWEYLNSLKQIKQKRI
ncbi:MAG: 3'-5' exoribonuclease [Cyanobacteria bacterium P01_E01_bin.6]